MAVNNRSVPLPGGPPAWKTDLFWAAGLLYVEAGTTLPFLGDAADLENVLAAGEVYAAGVVWSTASLGKRCTYFIFFLNHYNTHIYLYIHILYLFIFSDLSFFLWKHPSWSQLFSPMWCGIYISCCYDLNNFLCNTSF